MTLLETELYADGVIDQDEASILFEINDAVSGNANSPEWGDFFVRAVTDFVLQDETSPGVVDDDEAAFLINSVLADGTVDDLERALLTNIREQATSLALAIGVRGLMNIQFAVKGEDIYLLEVNPRASRTVPFVSKATSRPLAKIGARCMTGISLEDQGITGEIIPEYYSVKEAVFPFIKFPGVDPVLGPEMKSTGEVMGVGKTFGEAFDKAQKAAGADIPEKGRAFISVRDIDQPRVVEVARYLAGHGFEILATRGTAKIIEAAGVKVRQVNKVREGRPHIVDMIKNDEIDIVINTTEGKRSLKDSYTIRREALLHKVTNFTTLAAAKAAVEAHRADNEVTVYKLQDLHKTLK